MANGNKLLYTIHIPLNIPNSTKAKWPQVGAVVQTYNGKTFGRIELIPPSGWDGRFALFTPNTEGALRPDPEIPPDKLEEMPFNEEG